MRGGLLLGVLHVRDQGVDRLFHRRLVAAELDAALDEARVGDRLGIDVGDQLLVGPALLLQHLDLVPSCVGSFIVALAAISASGSSSSSRSIC